MRSRCYGRLWAKKRSAPGSGRSSAARIASWGTLGRRSMPFRKGFDLEPSVEMASGVVDSLLGQDHEDVALDFLAARLPQHRDEAMLAYLRGILLGRLGREGEAMREFRVAAERWRLDGVRDARATAVAREVDAYDSPRQAAASWSEHWFGRGRSATTRLLGVVLLAGLLAAFALPLIAPNKLSDLKYAAGWAAVTLPITVLVLLLVLPAVQSIKAGGGSFEITTIVLAERDRLTFALPSEIEIEKVADLPSLDAHALGIADQLESFLERGSADVPRAQTGRAAVR